MEASVQKKVDPLVASDQAREELLEPTSQPTTGISTSTMSFLTELLETKGPPQVVLLGVLIALGVVSTIGVVPAVMTDRYARLNHDYTDPRQCRMYTALEKPHDCLLGSADAQNSAALATMVSNGLTFVASAIVGSLSDEYGRRVMLMVSVALFTLPQVSLLVLLLVPHVSPTYYYACVSVTGMVSWVALSISAIADVVPPSKRVAWLGLAMAGYALGASVAPVGAVWTSHVSVALVSVTILMTALATVVLWLPETVPPEAALQARTTRVQQRQGLESWLQTALWWITRPIWELSMLNRNGLFRLLAIVSFCGDACYGGLQTLLVYYVEEQLNFTDTDVAIMYLLGGCLGVLAQAFVVKLVNDAWGERHVVMVTYALGAVVTLMYATTSRKAVILTGVSLNALVDMAIPTLVAIKSNNADPSEQGRVQGTFYSLTALATAFGPAAMRIVSNSTKHGAFLGPGSMFLVLTGLYSVAVVCSYALPIKSDSNRRGDYSQPTDRRENTDGTPLLPANDGLTSTDNGQSSQACRMTGTGSLD